jgi:adenosylmethionine-8-amino-7-oxononanoate aminotransferase
MTSYWHPFADMGVVEASGELPIVRGEGAYVFDADGRRYFDATAGLWYCNVGHGRAEIAEAAARQLRVLAAYNNYGDLTTPTASELAERVAAFAPVPGSKVFFCSGGSDAVDSAAKLARRYWYELGRPEKTLIVSRAGAYHGVNGFGTSIGGIPPNRDGFGPLIEGARVDRDSAAALADTIDRLGAEHVAAFFCEPVVGAGGVFPPPPGYLEDVERICRERDVLFVADEVITGFGRCGRWFASERFGLKPDLLTCAKGITSGYVPLGAVIASPRVAEPFFRPGVMWRHGYTYSGHAGACAAALANLDIIERERLVEGAADLERELVEALAPLSEHERVREVRAGTGVLAAVALEGDSALPARTLGELRSRGVLSRVLADGGLQISPPLVTTRADLDTLADAIADAVEAAAVALTGGGA